MGIKEDTFWNEHWVLRGSGESLIILFLKSSLHYMLTNLDLNKKKKKLINKEILMLCVGQCHLIFLFIHLSHVLNTIKDEQNKGESIFAKSIFAINIC